MDGFNTTDGLKKVKNIHFAYASQRDSYQTAQLVD